MDNVEHGIAETQIRLQMRDVDWFAVIEKNVTLWCLTIAITSYDDDAAYKTLLLY